MDEFTIRKDVILGNKKVTLKTKHVFMSNFATRKKETPDASDHEVATTFLDAGRVCMYLTPDKCKLYYTIWYEEK